MMIELSENQQQVFDKYIQRENIFITGPGGSGKSALIKYIYDDACHRGKTIQVTALTGCAAILLNCSAKTIHSWAGIGLGTAEADYLIEKIKKNRFKKKMWRETDILIVDEVSMMSLKLFELLNLVGKEVRGSRRPFGGIQIIFSGDFYQLPPVHISVDDLEEGQFCFESDQWTGEVFKKENQIALVKIFRQKDEFYANILNQIREGKIKRKSFEHLMTYVGRKVPEDSLIQPTKIFPTRAKVEHINMQEMAKLEGHGQEFAIRFLNDKKHKYTSEEQEMEFKYLERGIMCDSIITLKIGAQVMCIVNMEVADGQMLCNGSQGIVTGFSVTGLSPSFSQYACPGSDSSALGANPIIKFTNLEKEIVLSAHTWQSERCPGLSISQIPLILAWAITIHKSQGASLDMAEIDVGSNIFECGQTYVALSRVKSLEGLFLTSLDISKILINKKVQEFYKEL